MPWFDLVEMGCYIVLLVGLIAAAVDRIIMRRSEAEHAAAFTTLPIPADAESDGVVSPG